MVNVVNFCFCRYTFAKGHCHNFGLALDKTTNGISASVRDYEMFDPWACLDYQYGEVNGFHHHSLKHIHEFCKSCWSPSAGLKVLEFGAGPVIAYVIRASLYTSEIVLSEYMETNRKVLQIWLDCDPNAPNWSPFFK